MTPKVETQHMGEFLVSEGNGAISREVGTLASGEKVTDGRALAVNGAGKLVAVDGTLNTAGDSNEDVIGFVLGDHDATSADVQGVPYIARLAEVKASNVVLHSVTGSGAADATTAVIAALEKRNIVLR